MDYKKLSDAIRLCGSTPKINECKEKCPHYAGGDMTKCIPVMTKDAADAIIELNKELENNKRNLYYAVMQLRTIAWCNRCKHFRGIGGCELGDMNKCTEENDLYEWEGLDEKSN